MTLNPEIVVVNAGGAAYSGWERVQIRASMREAVRTFGVQTTEITSAVGSTFSFPPGTPVTITANGSLLVTGYVNRYRPSGDGKSHRIEIEGRGKGQDYVDCAAVHPTGYWENKGPDAIAKELDKFGVNVTAEVPLQPLEYFQLYQGETAHATIERALRDQGVTQMGKADGGVAITNASVAKRHSGGLIEGHNILKFSGVLSDDRRYSETEVKGQRRKGHGAENLRVKERFKDFGIRRYRPKVLIHEADTTKKRARDRAMHETERAAGFSVAATIITQGWRDDGGQVWEPNHLVYVQSPSLKIMGDMLVESVQWTQDSGGSVSELHLVDARAYRGKSGGANKTDAGWSNF